MIVTVFLCHLPSCFLRKTRFGNMNGTDEATETPGIMLSYLLKVLTNRLRHINSIRVDEFLSKWDEELNLGASTTMVCKYDAII